MTKFVVDAYAWIEYLEGSEEGRKFGSILENNSNEFFTSSATVSEVVSKFLRMGKDVQIALTAINSISTVLNLTQELGVLAGQIHFETKKLNKNFGMLDAFVVATARKINAKILTGDRDFKEFKETIFLK